MAHLLQFSEQVGRLPLQPLRETNSSARFETCPYVRLAERVGHIIHLAERDGYIIMTT